MWKALWSAGVGCDSAGLRKEANLFSKPCAELCLQRTKTLLEDFVGYLNKAIGLLMISAAVSYFNTVAHT